MIGLIGLKRSWGFKMTLRTLKDLDFFPDKTKERINLQVTSLSVDNGKKTKELINEWFLEIANLEKFAKSLLRQEAIKWIKHLENKNVPLVGPSSNPKMTNEYHTADWIKHFFNITEEDLK